MNVAGRVNMLVFDKTGTLTEEGLQVFGFRSTEKALVARKEMSIFGQFSHHCSGYQPIEDKWWLNDAMRDNLINDNKTLFLEALATCHSVTYVN